MMELPEAVVISEQVHAHLVDREIAKVTAFHTPHKFAWFYGDPADYPVRLQGKTVTGAEYHGGMIQIRLGPTSLVFHDGPSVRFLPAGSGPPEKHQLLLEFTDSSLLCGSVQMYGGFSCFEGREWDNEYYWMACHKPSPLTPEFSEVYFEDLCHTEGFPKLSAKAFLATEQRVPGLGNGVLQDILYRANLHPKRKMGTTSAQERARLFSAIKKTLREMADLGGRDTEKDLFGQAGGYQTVLSRKTVGQPCPRCGTLIQKAMYGGGSVYFCEVCQPFG